MNTLFTFGCSYTADFETNNIENLGFLLQNIDNDN
jgi:hypothetical protein